MPRYIIDKKIMGRLSLLVWCAGLILFAGFSFQHLTGLIDFLFSYLSSLVSDTKPSPEACLKPEMTAMKTESQSSQLSIES